MDFEVIPSYLAVKAMRDNGYKSPAYAIAELIDNAIQAKATRVDVLVAEEKIQLDRRVRSRIKEIAILDNGCGMNSEVLRKSLQFGNGLYLDPKDHKGIGRFGMGLPSSSISQAKRVDVWTWQNGPSSSIHSFLDLPQIESRKMTEIPLPETRLIPQQWLSIIGPPPDSGTLVVWSAIDRCIWRTAKALLDNSEALVGRIYRRFLSDKRVQINLVSFDVDLPADVKVRSARSNDPLYLMAETSCPPVEDIPAGQSMFMQWGNDTTYGVKFREATHEIRVRFSIAREEARQGYNPGDRPYGKHAAKNVGVSIVRADRELDLDAGWSDPSDPRDRWWGAEIEFPPALDEIFGVTNNKQSARYFSELAKINLADMLDPDQTLGALKEVMDADEDPRLPLMEIANQIRRNVSTMRGIVKAQTAGKNSGPRRHKDTAEAKATEATERRKQEGHSGESDQQEELPPEEKQEAIAQELQEQGVTKEKAEELAATTISRGFKYTFAHASLSTPAFFDVNSRGGSIIITLNTDHPAYENLLEVLEEDVENTSDEQLKTRLLRAGDGLKLLLSAWARYEDEQTAPKLRLNVHNARWDWGRMAREFLDHEG